MSADSPLLEVDSLRVRWDRTEVVRSVSLSVGEGQLLTVLGPNGSGKSTLLRAIAGFQPPAAGRVRLRGADLADIPPHRRSIGLLFQEPTLFPHRSVYENVAYSPMLRHLPRASVDAEVDRLARLLELGPLLDRSPEELSGGERQRVALARSLAARPALVLLDEPFASVDPQIKGALHSQFRAALRDAGTAAIHVTHDRDEGMFLGDRLAVLLDGTIASIGEPRAVFDRPPNERVARFLGYNILASEAGPLAVLPEELTLEPCEAPGGYAIVASGPAGATYRAILRSEDGDRVELRSRSPFPRSGRFRPVPRRSVALER